MKLREGSLTALMSIQYTSHDLAAVKGGIRLYTAAQESHETSRINCKTEKNRRMKEIMGLDWGKSARKRNNPHSVEKWKGKR